MPRSAQPQLPEKHSQSAGANRSKVVARSEPTKRSEPTERPESIERPEKVVQTKPPTETKPPNEAKPSAESNLPTADRQRRIETAAYEIAQRRGFQGDYQVDDWLEAERQIESAEGSGSKS